MMLSCWVVWGRTFSLSHSLHHPLAIQFTKALPMARRKVLESWISSRAPNYQGKGKILAEIWIPWRQWKMSETCHSRVEIRGARSSGNRRIFVPQTPHTIVLLLSSVSMCRMSPSDGKALWEASHLKSPAHEHIDDPIQQKPRNTTNPTHWAGCKSDLLT